MVPPVSLVVPAGPHSQIPQFSNRNGVSVQSNIFRGIDLGIEAALIVFSGLSSGAGCSPALDSFFYVLQGT